MQDEHFGIRDLFGGTALARQIILVFVLVAIASYVPVYLSHRAISKFPLVRKEVGSYSKRQQHLSPTKATERAIPDDVLNHLAGQRANLEPKYTGLNPDVPLVIHAIKSDLTLHLTKAHNSHSLFLEVRREIRSHFGTSETWREVDIHKPFLNIVAIASGYLFLGPDLCRRPEFLHASIDFTEGLFRAAGTLNTWTQLMRPIGKYFVPEVQTLRDYYRSLCEVLVPIVRERRKLPLQGAGKEDAPKDMQQWMVRKAHKFDVRTDEELAEHQLVLSFAAIHLTAMAAINLPGRHACLGRFLAAHEVKMMVATILLEPHEDYHDEESHRHLSRKCANDDNDAFWLAQVHFATGNYTRAQAFLSKQDLVARNPSCRYLAAHCFIKQSRFDEALAILGERNPTHLISNPANRRKAQHTSGRSTASNHGRAAARSHDRRDEASEEEIANRRYEAAMCFLRGICYAKQNAFDRAKECYKDAVRIDVQCFEAFQQLMKNSLMSPDEEWQFLESLDFDSITVPGDPSSSQEAAEFTRMLYTTRLSKYRNPDAFKSACETLSTHYNLSSNPDLRLAQADLLYTQCRYKDALAITDSVLQEDKYNFSIYPLHLACLYELRMKNVLFLVAHDLADSHPEEPCTWLAVGIYYFAVDKIAEARRYFSKASMMDAHFGPAWIGFAHTFAAEGEHDQAISAYSTAARLFMGTHLPQVFLGMQNHALNNMTLADEFLRTAYGLCKTDPLLLNEMGVVYYHQDRPAEAATLFQKALEVAEDIDSDPEAWLSARTNLAHAYRRSKKYHEALEQFDEVLRQGGKDAAVFSAKGLIYMELGKPEDAVEVLHQALAINPQDPIATELLNKALEETAGILALD
ncbi:hypothetical protein DL771_009380 [Monosporascus sp. 5C6A]|nr:hypothetical protein DL771_009380 [Monosporascus sp. 5C6A]